MLKYFRDNGLFGYNYWYVLSHIWIVPGEVYRRTKWFIQRGRRGWSDRDAWDLFDYLAWWLPDAIANIRKYKHGHPVGISDKKWTEVLRDMEEGFKAVRKVAALDYPMKDHKKWIRKGEKGLRLFHKYFYNLWD